MSPVNNPLQLSLTPSTSSENNHVRPRNTCTHKKSFIPINFFRTIWCYLGSETRNQEDQFAKAYAKCTNMKINNCINETDFHTFEKLNWSYCRVLFIALNHLYNKWIHRITTYVRHGNELHMVKILSKNNTHPHMSCEFCTYRIIPVHLVGYLSEAKFISNWDLTHSSIETVWQHFIPKF